MKHLAATLSLTLLAMPAMAQQAPANLRPTRDAAVTYRVESGTQPPQTIAVSWLVAQQKLRIVPPGVPGWMLVDLPAKRAVMVLEAQRMVMEMPGGDFAAMLDQVPEGATLTPRGTAVVASQSCNVWDVKSPKGEGSVCITTDGLMLRAAGTRRGQNAVLEATQVSYAALDPARFQVPQGFKVMSMPQGLPGMVVPK
jgi:hypothetical protein